MRRTAVCTDEVLWSALERELRELGERLSVSEEDAARKLRVSGVYGALVVAVDGKWKELCNTFAGYLWVGEAAPRNVLERWFKELWEPGTVVNEEVSAERLDTALQERGLAHVITGGDCEAMIVGSGSSMTMMCLLLEHGGSYVSACLDVAGSPLSEVRLEEVERDAILDILYCKLKGKAEATAVICDIDKASGVCCSGRLKDLKESSVVLKYLSRLALHMIRELPSKPPASSLVKFIVEYDVMGFGLLQLTPKKLVRVEYL